MNLNYRFLLLTLLFTLHFIAVNAQRSRKKVQRFGAGLVIGINATQLDGDLYTGYHKVGLQAGIEGIINLNPKSYLTTELLFMQKGSKISHYREGPKNKVLNLNFIDIPITLHLVLIEKRKITLEGGLSYSRLLSAKTIESPANSFNTPLETIVPDLKNDELNAILGVSANLNNHIQLSIRAVSAITKIYDSGIQRPPADVNNIYLLRNYFLSLRGIYLL